MLTLSQVIYGVRDLEAATRRMEERGLTVLDGGRHPGLGTANRIVPLGESYFEILGIVNEEEALSNPYGSALSQKIQMGDRLVRWSLRTDAIDEVARERGLTPKARSRRRPDGTLLTWKAAGLQLSLVDGWLPFFMQWDDPSHYPGKIPVRHTAQPQGIAWLEITPGDPVKLHKWLGAADLPLRIVDGTPGIHRVGLATPGGVLVLP